MQLYFVIIFIVILETASSSKVLECYRTDNGGSSYNGRVTRSECISWKDASFQWTNYYNEDHKFCRNPHVDLNAVAEPYCYTNSVAAFVKCGVKKCDEDCYTSDFISVSSTIPACDILITCSLQNLPPTITVSPNRTIFYSGEEVVFNCLEEGYLPTINSSTCLPNGSLDNSNVECKGILCPEFPTIQNMETQNTDILYRYPDSVNITCKNGYQTFGPNNVKCTEAGSWSPTPNCTGVPCPPIPYIDNSQNNHTRQYRFPDSVTIICNIGYKVNGSKSLECNSDGQWHKPYPVCIGVSCSKVPEIENSADIDDRQVYRYPMNVTIRCNSGFFLNGSNTLECNADGKWSTPPKCIGFPCPEINEEKNRHHEPINSLYRIGDKVFFTCKSGYTLSNSDTKIECVSHETNFTIGKWSFSFPSCIVQNRASPIGVIVGSSSAVVSLFFIALIAIMIMLCKRRRGGKRREHTHSNDKTDYTANEYANAKLNSRDKSKEFSSDDHTYYDFDVTRISKTAIEKNKFHQFVECNRGIKGEIGMEFSLLQSGATKPTTVAQVPANIKKNKYKNIYPYDETRVVLERIEDSLNSDYINASFINGYGKIKQYIASQGPLSPTVDDWWRMVWQYDCAKIVMLTRVFEMGKEKCIKYWPDKEQKTLTFGKIDIILQTETVYSDFTIRTLKLVKHDEQKTVKQFQFTAWPDKDVPKYASSLVHFRKKVNNTEFVNKGPLVVHCSAGIGRTGTFIALDYAVTEANQLGYVDIFRCVEMLRRQRLNMVQTTRQYIFLHEAVLEALMCNNESIPATEFPRVYEQSIVSTTGKTKLELEFELMTNMGHKHDEEVFEAGKSIENRNKNRYSNILPVFSEMPALSTPVDGRTEYINAVFLPGYKSNKSFIITQMPLGSTVIDLWRLVWDYNIKEVVMMNQSYEQKEVYWPTENNADLSCDPFTVSLKDQVNNEVLSIKKLMLAYKNQEKREVKLVQSSFWSDEALIPSSVQNFIYFMTEQEQECEKQEEDGPVVVHCSNGCDKSGLYCVMATVLERLRIEQDVDIQHTIKEMRNRRPQIIPYYEQYHFLHKAVCKYLEQFETYSNFQ